MTKRKWLALTPEEQAKRPKATNTHSVVHLRKVAAARAFIRDKCKHLKPDEKAARFRAMVQGGL